MIKLYFTVDNISTVIAIYDRIRIQKSTATSEPSVNDPSWAPIPGGDLVAMIDVGYSTTLDSSDNIVLVNGQNNYGVIDTDGEPSHWYRSQYFDSTTSGVESAWSDPILGEEGDLYYNPLYPSEISYGTADQLIIDRIRTLIGDPIGLNREYGQDAYSSLHPDNRTYELDEKAGQLVLQWGMFNIMMAPILM